MKKTDYKMRKKKFNIIIIVIIILMLICVNIILLVNKVFTPKVKVEQINKNYNQISSNTNQKDNENETVQKTSEQVILDKLKAGTERERMEYYVGQYISHIEYEEYEKAYEMLYSEFKQNYFPTLEKFEQYAKKTYPDTIGLEYTDIDRQGKLYVIFLKINDIIKGTESKTQRIIVQEND